MGGRAAAVISPDGPGPSCEPETKSMNPLKSIPGTIISGFILAIIIALLL